jgi:chromate transport protein ChrA
MPGPIQNSLRNDHFAQVICLLAIFSISMLGIIAVDMKLMVSYSSSNIILDYAASMVPAFAAVALLTLLDHKYVSENVKQNLVHSTAFMVMIMLTMLVWSYGQYTLASNSWPSGLSSDLLAFQQMIVARIILFLIGAPILAYLVSHLKMQK